MKRMLIVVLLAGLVFPALGADKADLEKKLGLLSAKFEELQAKPDKAVPADNLKRACGVVMLYRVKGGLVFGYEGGSGVAMIRNGVSNRWSAPVFMKSNEGSFGAQIGGQGIGQGHKRHGRRG